MLQAIRNNFFKIVIVLVAIGGIVAVVFASGSVNTRITKTENGLTDLSARVDKLEGKVVGVQKTAETVSVRLDKRVQAENDPLFAKWQAIKAQDGDDSELGQKSEEEIKALLTNGIWDIESEIQKEYDALIASSVGDASSLADAANQKAEKAEEKADAAQKTANVSIEAVEIIAQPTKCGHHAVTKEGKATIREKIAQWRKENPAE